jgi:hypothetical protein
MAIEPNRIGDTLIDIGLRMRLAALCVEALAREKDRSEDGQAICALLCQLSEEIAEVSALVTTDDCASLERNSMLRPCASPSVVARGVNIGAPPTLLNSGVMRRNRPTPAQR